MSPAAKILIGLAAVAAMGWVHHGLLGNGEAYVGRLEAEARRAVAATEIGGVDVKLGRDPLSRHATLSGTADRFQREGQGSLKGLNDHVREIEGISGVSWADEGEGGGIPLFLELLGQLLLAYLLGLALGWLLWGRRKRENYLG